MPAAPSRPCDHPGVRFTIVGPVTDPECGLYTACTECGQRFTAANPLKSKRGLDGYTYPIPHPEPDGPDCAAADRADALYESREYAAERARGRE